MRITQFGFDRLLVSGLYDYELFWKKLKGSVRKKAISDCCVFVLKVDAQPISADSDFEDKRPNLCFAEISKPK